MYESRIYFHFKKVKLYRNKKSFKITKNNTFYAIIFTQEAVYLDCKQCNNNEILEKINISEKLVSCVECRKESKVALALLAPVAQKMKELGIYLV